MATYLADDIKPYFDEHLKEELQDGSVETKIGDSVDKLHIPYPTCLEEWRFVVPTGICFTRTRWQERNYTVKPTSARAIHKSLVVPSLEYPLPTVSVLAPERTYWEKATLIHAECNRENAKANAERLSRHWYDLFQLNRSEIGSVALSNKKLLEEVINQKNILYPSGWAKYNECLGSLRLIPDATSLKSLEEDFDQMRANAMFWDEPETFQNIIDELSQLETTINKMFA